MRCRSPAKIAASSPPAAARISRKTLWSSSGSAGTSSRCSAASSVRSRALERGDLLFRERAQPAPGRPRSARAAASSRSRPDEAREAARDRVDAREFHGQFAKPVGAAEHLRDRRACARSRRGGRRHARAGGGSLPSWRISPRAEQARGRLGERGIAAFGRLAQRGRWRMQQPVGERRGELLEHLRLADGRPRAGAAPLRAAGRAPPRPGREARGSSARHPAP